MITSAALKTQSGRSNRFGKIPSGKAKATAKAIPVTVLQAHKPPTNAREYHCQFITIAEQNLLITTDYAGNLARTSKLIDTIDQAGPSNSVSYCQAKYVEASELSKQIMQTSSARSQPGTTLQKVEALFDERTNKLILVGTEARHLSIEQIKFAPPTGTMIQSYSSPSCSYASTTQNFLPSRVIGFNAVLRFSQPRSTQISWHFLNAPPYPSGTKMVSAPNTHVGVFCH